MFRAFDYDYRRTLDEYKQLSKARAARARKPSRDARERAERMADLYRQAALSDRLEALRDTLEPTDRAPAPRPAPRPQGAGRTPTPN